MTIWLNNFVSLFVIPGEETWGIFKRDINEILSQN